MSLLLVPSIADTLIELLEAALEIVDLKVTQLLLQVVHLLHRERVNRLSCALHKARERSNFFLKPCT